MVGRGPDVKNTGHAITRAFCTVNCRGRDGNVSENLSQLGGDEERKGVGGVLGQDEIKEKRLNLQS